ncbi:MAG: proline dehydrogenase family protein [Candidatus Velthaea sp.]
MARTRCNDMAVIDRLLAPDSSFQQRFFFLAKRFVAGESAVAAMDAIETLNSAGLIATLDFLGEDVTQRDEALRTRDAYFELLAAIRARGVSTNVSVKLTAMGLLVSEDFAYENLCAVLDAAKENADPFVRIDMEGSAVVDATLRIFERVFAERRNVGPVLQAYLKRTPDDVERTIELGARVRLCKGAYSEPPIIAHKDMPVIRREYLRLAESLLTRGTYPGIATHDERIISAVKTFVDDHGIARDAFEFQLLYGIRPDIQKQLVREGYRVRVYVPYGTHWAGYFYRRIMERKENAFFVLGSLLKK